MFGMKRLIIMFLALGMILCAVAACGGSGTSGGAGSSGADAVAAIIDSEIGGEITVSCYDPMVYKAFLDEAARLFEKKYPGVKVNVETFSAMPEIRTSESGGVRISMVEAQDNPQGRSDYLSKVSTALMSGEGADIYAVDVLPTHKFADSGQLENLANYMEADRDFDKSAYRSNILQALAYKGGLWFVPMDYSFNFLTYDSTLLRGDEASFNLRSAFTVEQLINAAAPVFDGSGRLFNLSDYNRFQGGGGGGLYSYLLNESYNSYVDIENRQAHFTDRGFAEMLTSLKEYTELGYVSEGIPMQPNAGAVRMSAQEPPTERFYYKYKNSMMLMQHFNRDSERRMMISYGGAAAGIEADDEIAGIVADADGNVPFTFQQAYALNSSSKNKQTAWAFLKFLLSEEMQLSASLMPLSQPLHNDARTQKAELTLSGAFMGEQSQPLDEAQQEVLRRYTEAVEQLSDQINAYTMKDSIIDDMIASEVRYFFDGVKSAAEVAQVLQNRVTLYLNE